MLQAFVFERVGIVVGDLYFLDPNPHPGQEGAEHGVRLELRVFDRGDLKGTIYSAMPIEVGRPIWRVDLLEAVDGKPGSFNRTHHHPKFNGWDPTGRQFLRELSSDPLGWLAAQLADLPAVLERAGGAAGGGRPLRRGVAAGHRAGDRRRDQHDAGQGPRGRARPAARPTTRSTASGTAGCNSPFAGFPRSADRMAAITMNATDS